MIEDTELEIEDSFSAVTVYRDTGEVIRKFYTGTKKECIETLIELIKDRGYDSLDLSIINNNTGKLVSYLLDLK